MKQRQFNCKFRLEWQDVPLVVLDNTNTIMVSHKIAATMYEPAGRPWTGLRGPVAGALEGGRAGWRETENSLAREPTVLAALRAGGNLLIVTSSISTHCERGWRLRRSLCRCSCRPSAVDPRYGPRRARSRRTRSERPPPGNRSAAAPGPSSTPGRSNRSGHDVRVRLFPPETEQDKSWLPRYFIISILTVEKARSNWRTQLAKPKDYRHLYSIEVFAISCTFN